MKWLKVFAALAAVTAVLTVGLLAHASERVLCTLSVSTTAADTATPTSGTCSWAKGAIVAMQCPNLVVYYDPNGTATTSDILVDFTANPDPYLIDLRASESTISVRTSSGTGTCVFADTVK